VTRCPTCRAQTTKEKAPKVYPFCSERCYLVDLGRWLGEEYRVPGEPAEVVAAADDGNENPTKDGTS
jgi:endogenous inhibitor of DNA gyrase (YacG/DUF329 family)